VINFSNKPVTVKLASVYHKGKYTELFSKKAFTLQGDDVITLGPWKYLILVKDK
jgi:hypothetical protein